MKTLAETVFRLPNVLKHFASPSMNQPLALTPDQGLGIKIEAWNLNLKPSLW